MRKQKTKNSEPKIKERQKKILTRGLELVPSNQTYL